MKLTKNKISKIIVTGNERKRLITGNIILGKNKISTYMEFPKSNVFYTLEEAKRASKAIELRIKKLQQDTKIAKKKTAKKTVKKKTAKKTAKKKTTK